MRAVNRLSKFRAMAESRMTDTCLITAPDPDGTPVWNPATGAYDDPPPITVYGPDVAPYNGMCRIKSPQLVNPFAAASGPEVWQVEQSILSVPALAPPILSGMTVTYLSSTYNPGLTGHVFGVVGPHHESQATAQRVLVKEVVGVGDGGGSS